MDRVRGWVWGRRRGRGRVRGRVRVRAWVRARASKLTASHDAHDHRILLLVLDLEPVL